jgi:hypothetical protein
MSIGAIGSSIQSLVQNTGSADPGSTKAAIQVSVRKQANDAQAQASLSLIEGVGQKLNTRG